MAAIRRRQLPRQRPTLIPPSLPVWCSTRGCEMPREVKFLQHRKQLSAIASVVLLALAGKAHALDIDYQIGLSTLQSNNIGLANTDTRDDTVLAPTTRFDATQAGSILNLQPRGEYQKLDYSDTPFDNEQRRA